MGVIAESTPYERVIQGEFGLPFRWRWWTEARELDGADIPAVRRPHHRFVSETTWIGPLLASIAVTAVAMPWTVRIPRTLLAGLRRRRRAFALSRGTCPACRYDLTALGAPTCPECGDSVAAPA